jgi:hypothetical protein
VTLLRATVNSRPPDEPDAEALIREARRLRRRRWLFGGLVVLLAVAVIVAGLVASDGTGHPARQTNLAFHAGSPTVDARAFAAEGDLAFVSRDAVYVLDGATKYLRHLVLPSGIVPGAPSFSHGGHWLAFSATSTVTAPNGDESTRSTLWVADADGSHLHEVTGLDNPEFLGWSPTSDLFAVTSQGKISTTYQPPPGSAYVTKPTSLWLVSPSGARREIVRPDAGMIDGATWSPDGSEVAVGSLSAYPFQDHVPWSATLTAYPIDGATPTVWLRIVNPRSNSCCDTVALKQSQFIPVGWWPHWGIVFWGSSADVGSGLDGGGFPLFAIPAKDDKPIPLGRTPAGGQVSTIVASESGALAISNNPGNSGTRPFWQNEQVLRCNPSSLSCEPVTSAVDTVSFDPVWSPDGSQLAYLVGKANGEGNAGFAQAAVSSWYDSLQLWLYSPRTGRSSELRAAKGAVVPIWSEDSKSLLYVDDDGLWLLKNPKSRPVEVAGPLLPPDDWNPYFAQVNWFGLFAWSRSQNLPQPGVLTPM